MTVKLTLFFEDQPDSHFVEVYTEGIYGALGTVLDAVQMDPAEHRAIRRAVIDVDADLSEIHTQREEYSHER